MGKMIFCVYCVFTQDGVRVYFVLLRTDIKFNIF